jgi:flagellar protein FlbD
MSRKEMHMITLHRLNKQEFVLNSDLIETLESTPDTLVTLTTGKKLLVRDAVQDVIGRVINYRQLCNGAIRVLHEEKKEMPPEAEGESAAGARTKGDIKRK